MTICALLWVECFVVTTSRLELSRRPGMHGWSAFCLYCLLALPEDPGGVLLAYGLSFLVPRKFSGASYSLLPYYATLMNAWGSDLKAIPQFAERPWTVCSRHTSQPWYFFCTSLWLLINRLCSIAQNTSTCNTCVHNLIIRILRLNSSQTCIYGACLNDRFSLSDVADNTIAEYWYFTITAQTYFQFKPTSFRLWFLLQTEYPYRGSVEGYVYYQWLRYCYNLRKIWTSVWLLRTVS